MQIWAESRKEEVTPERLRDEVFSVLGGSWGWGPACIGLWRERQRSLKVAMRIEICCSWRQFLPWWRESLLFFSNFCKVYISVKIIITRVTTVYPESCVLGPKTGLWEDTGHRDNKRGQQCGLLSRWTSDPFLKRQRTDRKRETETDGGTWETDRQTERHKKADTEAERSALGSRNNKNREQAKSETGMRAWKGGRN